MRFLALLAILVLSPPTPVPATSDLSDAVAAQVPAREESTGTQVNVLRQDRAEAGGWAFGTAVRLAPAEPDAYPDGWLWLAEDRGDGWRVALEGAPGFAELSRWAPILAAGERTVLGELAGTREEAATDYRTGMRLPYAVGQTWQYTGGPHPMSGGTYSSIDLAGPLSGAGGDRRGRSEGAGLRQGDGKVRAARDGVAYTMCGKGTGWLRVVHDRGFATDYYHLRNGVSADGKRVSEGDVLGRIGTDVACGGYVTGPHVHFSLRRDGKYVAIDRYGFGKWSIRAGGSAYEGYARHGSRRVNVDGGLRNYGALGLTQAVVDTNGGERLNRRAGPGTDHKVVGTVRDGATVRVECSARGTTHTGRAGNTSDVWNRLGNGGWVSDVYLWTGTGNPVSGWC